MDLITRLRDGISIGRESWSHMVYPVAREWAIASVLAVVALMFIELALLLTLRWCRSRMTVSRLSLTLLELTFPADVRKSAYATEQLYLYLHTRSRAQSWRERICRQTYSLEIVATRNDGIRYVLGVPSYDEEAIRRSLLSFLPGLKIHRVTDYVPQLETTKQTLEVAELSLAADWMLPLAQQEALSEHDPIAFVTGQMAKLAPDALASWQLVISPVTAASHPRLSLRLAKVQRYIAGGKPLSSLLNHRMALPGIVLPIVARVIVGPMVWTLAGGVRAVIELPEFLTDDKYYSHRQTARLATSRRAVDPREAELAQSVQDKARKHLYAVTMRLLVAGESEVMVKQRLQGMAASMRSFSTAHQMIRVKRNWPLVSSAALRLSDYRRRQAPGNLAGSPMVLSSTELSGLYHFPSAIAAATEGLVKSRSPELPAPLSLRSTKTEFDVVIGLNNYGGEVSPIGLTLGQRQKHMYVIGKTGMGKTTLLTSAIYQDMFAGKGLAVLDPHGDMFRKLLKIVPEHRRQDVVVFDPSDRDFPIGLNILDPGIEFASEDDKHEWITSTVLSVFAKLTDENFWGPRMEHVLRNATMTALALPSPSLYTLQRLLTDKTYQKEAAKSLKDPILRQFWQKEFALLGDMQLSTVTAPLTHRLGHFITTKMPRHILLQQASSLRIADVMNEGKILLVNLSKGDLGEDQSRFFGTILTSLIWMAAYQRTKIPEAERRDFFVYVDEFQNFATPRFAEITSEGRKFHVSLIASHQNVAQIEDRDLLKIVAGNAGTIICLKASPGDEEFILPFMRPAVAKGDIVSLAPYQFFMKTSSDVSEDAFTGHSVPLEIIGSESVAAGVVAVSREQYGTPRRVVEDYVESLLTEAKPSRRTQDKPSEQQPDLSETEAPSHLRRRDLEA
jgi:hypothetical protein